MTHPFSVKEAYKTGWHLLRAHSALAFKVVLTLLALQIASSVVEKVLEGTALGVVGGIVLGVASAVAGIGATVITLKLAEHKHAAYADLIPPWSILWRFVVSGIVVALVVVVPLVIGVFLGTMAIFSLFPDTFSALPATGLDSIPAGASVIAAVLALVAIGAALYLGIRYSMVRYAVVDRAGVVESLRKSWHMTHGATLKLVLFALATIALNLVGALLLMVGLLVTIPLTMLAMAHVYLKLKARHHHA